MNKAVATLAIAALVAATAWSETDTRTPLEAYGGAVFYNRTMCQLTFKSATMSAELGQQPTSEEERKKVDYRRCIDDGKKSIKARYEAALRTVKKPAARAALKEHYIASLSSLTAIVPQLNERQISYDKRQGDAEARVDELWTRFEVEN